MIFGIIGLLILLISALFLRDINMILLGIGMIAFDVIAELALLNTNLKVMIQNNVVLFDRVIKAIKEKAK